MQPHEETEVYLADWHSSEAISGVPIKKRLFRSSQCSSSPSRETCATPHNCMGQPKEFLPEAESSVSESSAGLALDTNISPQDFLKSSSVSAQSSYGTYLCGGLNTSLLHGNAVQVNHEELELKKATSAFKGSNMVEDLNIDNRSSLGLDMVGRIQLSQLSKFEMIVGDRIAEGKFASSNGSAFKGVETTSSLDLSSGKDKKYHGLKSSRQEKIETCSLALPLAKGLQHLHQTIYNDLDSKYGSAHLCMNREKWDLNFPMEVWDANSNDSFMEHDMDGRLNHRAMHQQKIDRHLLQTTLGTIGSDLTSGTSMVGRSEYNPRFTNLGIPADDKRDYEGGLDLQLGPPSRPELQINWGKICPPDLSLSLTGNLSDASCTVMKPEPSKNNTKKETETFKLSSLNSVGIRHVKSEPCDGSFQGEASKVAVPFDRESSVGRVVKSEPPEEPKEKSSNLELDNHQLTLCCTEAPPSKVKHVVSNSNAVPDANMLHDDRPVVSGNKKIKSGENTCLDTAPVSGPDIPCKAEDVLTDICTHQDAEGSPSKSLDAVVGSVISAAKRCNEKDTEIREIDDMAPTLHRESVVSDLEEPMACDGMSEGSAEMDCLDDEYYTSWEGMDLPAEIQIKQFNGNEQQMDAPQGLGGARDNITGLEGGHVEGEGGELRDLVPQCADEVSCEYEEKGIHANTPQCANEVPCTYEKKEHGNVVIDSIGSDSVPGMMEIHLDTKGKQIVSEEARSCQSAEKFDVSMCCDQKETSCDLTTGLHESSATRVLRTSSSKRLTKPCQEATENHLVREKGLKMKSTSIKSPNVITKANEDYVGRRLMNIRYAHVSIKHPEQSERDSNVCGTAIKYVDDAGKHSHIKDVDNRCKQRPSKKVNLPIIRSFCQSKPFSARSGPSETETERLIDKQRRDRLYSPGRRPSNFEIKKNQDLPVGKCDSDYMNTTRRDGNRHFDRNSNTQHALELNNSRKYRFPRPSKGLEVPFNIASNSSVGSAGRLLRPINDQPHHSSRLPPWRQLPRPREEPPFLGTRNARCLAWDAGPDRYTGREVHDDLLAHEEKMMRSQTGEIGDNLLYSHPSLQYEPSENGLLPRGRSLSPIHRRPPPVQLYRARSPHQWSSPGRTPEMVIDKRSELIRHGPPSVDRFDMSRSHPHPCFPEDVIVRRNVSPPYTQLPLDMREMHPINDLDLPRPCRVLQRHNRRFDLGPYETAEDYIGPSHFTDQFVDRRDYRDRRGLIQPMRPRHVSGDDEEDTLPYPVDDGCHRPIKFCPEGEVFPDRGSSRDFDSHVRNRLGNAAHRLRSTVEQGEDYKYHGKQGWRDISFNDVGLKRRKL